MCLVTQMCLSVCNSKDHGQPGFSIHGDSPGKTIGMGCHALLQGIFPTQRLNPGLPHCMWILQYLSHQGSPGREGIWSKDCFVQRSWFKVKQEHNVFWGHLGAIFPHSLVNICLQFGRPGFDSWVGKIPWRRKWQPTPVFLPEESHGQRDRGACLATVHGVTRVRHELVTKLLLLDTIYGL